MSQNSGPENLPAIIPAADILQTGARLYLGKTDARDPLASPLFGDLSGLPPLLIQVGTDERLLDDARQYADRAAFAGTKVKVNLINPGPMRTLMRQKAMPGEDPSYLVKPEDLAPKVVEMLSPSWDRNETIIQFQK